VAGPLRQAGHEVYRITLTGLAEREHLVNPEVGLDTHIEDVVRLLEVEELESVTLVGHSYAGMVVTGVADRIPGRIARLVFLDASVPDDGESMFGNDEQYQAYAEGQAKAFDGYRWPLPTFEEMEQNLEVDLTGEQQERFRRKSSPHPIKTMSQPLRLGASNSRQIPRTFVYCATAREGEQGPPYLDYFRSTPGWSLERLYTGHWPMFSMPLETAALLERIAGS
jgi:pimeloyl-ACP methyl ester carboxylesterase